MRFEENRQAIESLTTAFKALAVNAKAKRWPAETVADAAFRAAVTLHMAQFGLAPTVTALARLSEELGSVGIHRELMTAAAM